MGRKIILSPRALQDLEKIVRYIATDSPERALNFGLALVARLQDVAAFPDSGRIVPEFEDPGIREVIHGAYRIVYRLSRDGAFIEVARFWHAARGNPEVS